MANGDSPQNLALQDSEDDDFGIPGEQDERSFDAGAQPSTTGQTSPQSTANASAGPSAQSSGIQQANTANQGQLSVDTSEKIHPHMAILAGLANKLLSAVQNAPGNPRNAFDRGFMNASPNQQAMQSAALSKAQSAADLEKLQVSMTGMKALQLEYMIKRLPQQLQQEHLDKISEFKQNLIKEGANIEAEGDDEKASDAQAFHLNQSDPRALQHAGKFYSLPTMDKDGNAKFDVVFVPNKDTLQNDFTWTDPDGNEQTVKAGTSLSATLGRFVEMQSKGAQNQTKAEHQAMGNALTPNVPENEINQTVNWLESQQKQNTPLYQQNKAAVDAQIGSLRKAQQETQQQKERQAAAGAARTEEKQTFGKAVLAHTDDGDMIMSSKEAKEQGIDDFETIPAPMAQKAREQSANADASMNALHNYRDTFSKVAPKLNATDRDNLRAVTQSLQAHAGGILGGLIDDLPLAGPLSNYTNKLLQGATMATAYKNLSPEGKTLVAQYAMAVVANFANMKQMLGSVGRNPAMIEAESKQIPLPDLDAQTADKMLATKISDVKQRNSSIPKVFHKGGKKPVDEINREGLWEVAND